MSDPIDRGMAITHVYVALFPNISAAEKADKALREAPTVDAVEVVRCKDCKHYTYADNRAFGFPVKRCEWTGFEDVDENDFCSRGERRTDE